MTLKTDLATGITPALNRSEPGTYGWLFLCCAVFGKSWTCEHRIKIGRSGTSMFKKLRGDVRSSATRRQKRREQQSFKNTGFKNAVGGLARVGTYSVTRRDDQKEESSRIFFFEAVYGGCTGATSFYFALYGSIWVK